MLVTVLDCPQQCSVMQVPTISPIWSRISNKPFLPCLYLKVQSVGKACVVVERIRIACIYQYPQAMCVMKEPHTHTHALALSSLCHTLRWVCFRLAYLELHFFHLEFMCVRVYVCVWERYVTVLSLPFLYLRHNLLLFEGLYDDLWFVDGRESMMDSLPSLHSISDFLCWKELWSSTSQPARY